MTFRPTMNALAAHAQSDNMTEKTLFLARFAKAGITGSTSFLLALQKQLKEEFSLATSLQKYRGGHRLMLTTQGQQYVNNLSKLAA